jgi:type IV secretory pathway VirB2 component (pilin)
VSDGLGHFSLDGKLPSGQAEGHQQMTRHVITTFSIVEPSVAAVPAAVDWAVGKLLGSVATGTGVLAVTFLGFGMLFAHLDWRTRVRVVLGIFILFGAPIIARELMALA